MAYELGVTEVGAAEYPLIEVLRETIFGEVGHRSLTSIADDLEGRRDVLCLIAHLEGNPVGFKVGHGGDRPGVYYSKAGGVLREYRRLGLGRRMQEWQHGFARSRGYRDVYFNTFNHFPDMIRFGLRSGFVPVAAEWRELGGMSFKFSMSLESPTAAIPSASGNGERGDAPVASWLEVRHDDREALLRALACGFELTGIRRDTQTGHTLVRLDPPNRA